MKVAATSDWRDGIAFESPTLVADVSPGEDARCSVCGGDSQPRPRTELWAVKHRHPKHHGGFVRFYCREHLPVIRVETPAPVPARGERGRGERRAAAPRRTPTVPEKPRALCPDCFVEVPDSGLCGMCGNTVA